MIKITKIIQTIKMKVTTQQTNTCSMLTMEKKFWLLYGYLSTYFLPCSNVFNVDFEHVIVHYFSITNIKDLCFTFIENLHVFLPNFLKNVSHYIKIHLIDLKLFRLFFRGLIQILDWFKRP